ncbi:hypothetical protein L2E82_25127 [Cichorium intybus]|uniref:Uncharacterized protein n=1 Tax=Cichorium intybus TaxID=13427 RepID=A0ACB9E2S3_CICIN|nr:hypothetical protein L2E82_25127 [Cichorium intybus]
MEVKDSASEHCGTLRGGGGSAGRRRRDGRRQEKGRSAMALMVRVCFKQKERDRAVRTGRPGGGRSEAATTAADDWRPGEDVGGALAAVDVAGSDWWSENATLVLISSIYINHQI